MAEPPPAKSSITSVHSPNNTAKNTTPPPSPGLANTSPCSLPFTRVKLTSIISCREHTTSGNCWSISRPPSDNRSTHQNPHRWITSRSEEHTSELQSRGHLVCRLLLEKKN